MEILKRAKGDSGERISFLESESNVKEEAIRRSAKAGHCRMRTKIMTTVPCGKTRLNVWPRDAQGNLIE